MPVMAARNKERTLTKMTTEGKAFMQLNICQCHTIMMALLCKLTSDGYLPHSSALILSMSSRTESNAMHITKQMFVLDDPNVSLKLSRSLGVISDKNILYRCHPISRC